MNWQKFARDTLPQPRRLTLCRYDDMAWEQIQAESGFVVAPIWYRYEMEVFLYDSPSDFQFEMYYGRYSHWCYIDEPGEE